MDFIQLVAEVKSPDWTTIIVTAVVAIIGIFASTGFWEWMKAKLAAKREDKKEEKDYDDKLDKITDHVSEISTQVTAIEDKVDFLSEDMQDLKKDLILLQEANEATVKYREMRDNQDKEALKIQDAFIKSITGLMRDRLLDNYRRCMKKGYYTREEREIYGQMFECYENPPFRGNGVMHDLRPIMKALPVEPPNGNYDDNDD